MNGFVDNWKKLMYGKEVDIRARLLCNILTVSAVLSSLAFVEVLVVENGTLTPVALFAMVVAVFVSLYLTVQKNKVSLSAYIIAIALCFDIMPCIYFGGGGIRGGATVWFILNFVYAYMMFSGKILWIAVGIDSVSIVAWYLIGYFYPQTITPLSNEAMVLFDSIFSVTAVGIAVSLMMRFHNNVYAEQRAMVEWQKEELEKKQESKTHFFASMSHELRAPINTVIGLNGMILRNTKEPETIEYAKIIQKSSRLLLSLISDILDMSQLETNKMTIAQNEYVGVDALAEIIDMAGVLAKEKGLEFTVDIDENLPSRLSGDRRRINQVLLNLLSNAVKYTPQGAVTFSVKADEITEDSVLLRMVVKDTGIGIKKENLENIYDIFKRVDSSVNESIEGSGLGLAITKHLVDAMGGKIMVDSIYTQGSTFTVLLRQTVVDASPIGNIMDLMEASSKEKIQYEQLFEAPSARVLIVDDDPTNGMIVRKMLEKTQMNIDVATSGEECLSYTRSKYYHAILMDYMMPEMDGPETLKEIRRQVNGLCRNAPVLALTATSFSMADSYFRNLGFDGYLEKPVDAILLETTLLELLPEEYVLKHNVKRKYPGREYAKPAVKRRKKQVLITCDCVADVSKSFLERYNIEQMYLYIDTKQGRFKDTIEINSDSMISFEPSEIWVKNVTVEEYELFFAKQLTKAEDVIFISLGSGCGVSYEIAQKAAKSFDHVHVVDSRQISCGQRMLTMYAGLLASRGESYEEIIEKITQVSKQIITKMYIPDVERLYKMDRISKIVRDVCNLLHATPCFGMKNGAFHLEGIRIGDEQKGRLRFIRGALAGKKKVSDNAIFHSFAGLTAKERNEILEEIQRCRGEDATIYSQKASLSAICGSGVGSIAVSYYTGKSGDSMMLNEETNVYL